jgi:CheY-like chemotaxis protein
MALSKKGKHRIQLVHWDKAEADTKAKTLRAAGYVVAREIPGGPSALRKLSDTEPSAVVIDLSRRPATGRDVALAIRSYKALRYVPILFVEGESEKLAQIKKLLPDAAFTTWNRIRSALKRAIAHPPSEPAVPSSVFAGYAATALPKKLGIKPHTIVALIGAPRGFEKTLGRLPEAVTLRRQARGSSDLTLWFTKSLKDLESRIRPMGRRADKGGLWIIWPKKNSALASDLSQVIVRKTGLASGLVDYKVCSIDETWTGLKFTCRQS